MVTSNVNENRSPSLRAVAASPRILGLTTLPAAPPPISLSIKPAEGATNILWGCLGTGPPPRLCGMVTMTATVPVKVHNITLKAVGEEKTYSQRKDSLVSNLTRRKKDNQLFYTEVVLYAERNNHVHHGNGHHRNSHDSGSSTTSSPNADASPAVCASPGLLGLPYDVNVEAPPPFDLNPPPFALNGDVSSLAPVPHPAPSRRTALSRATLSPSFHSNARATTTYLSSSVSTNTEFIIYNDSPPVYAPSPKANPFTTPTIVSPPIVPNEVPIAASIMRAQKSPATSPFSSVIDREKAMPVTDLDNGLFGVGTHYFEFDIGNLPDDLPGTYHGDNGSVAYNITVSVDRYTTPATGLTNSTSTIEVPIPRFHLQSLLRPWSETTISNRDSSSNIVVKYEAVVPRTCISLKEELKFLLHISAVESGYRVRGLHAKVVQITETRSDPSSSTSGLERTKSIDLVEIDDLQKTNGEYWRKEFTMPPVASSRSRPTYDGRRIKVRHELVVELLRDQEGSMGKNLGQIVCPLYLHGLSDEAKEYVLAYANDSSAPMNAHRLNSISYVVKRTV